MTRKKERPYGSSLKNKVDALFGGSSPPETTRDIPIELIVLPEYQPRQYFDETKLEELAATIQNRGILEPLLVREVDGGRFELIAGGRRYRAAQRSGLAEVPVVVLALTDEEALEVALLENIQRENLNPVEETEGILRLLAVRLKLDRLGVLSLLYRMRNEVKGATSRNVSASPEAEVVEELFTHLGITWKSFVETRLPLLNLPEEIQEALRQGRIAYTKATAIARVKDPEFRKALLEEAIFSNLSLNQIKERIKENQPLAEPTILAEKLNDTIRRFQKAKLWENKTKRKKLEKLMAQMEALLEEKD